MENDIPIYCYENGGVTGNSGNKSRKPLQRKGFAVTTKKSKVVTRREVVSKLRANDDFRMHRNATDYKKMLVSKGIASDMRDADRVMRMRIPKESHYQTKILRALRKEFPEGRWRKNAAGIGQSAGEPDIDGVLHGRFIAVECKRPFVGRVSDLQYKAISEINAAGGLAIVGVYADEVVQAVRDYIEAVNDCMKGV